MFCNFLIITMNENNNKSLGHDMVCKNHNARAEKDVNRTCPAKLTKRELEDLYFALLENNLDLKKTINNQKEKLRELTTKVQRMTAAQRCSLSKEQKECCIMTKAICNEQKEAIADLKNTNERLSERIKLLNMKLCSAKQFLQRNPLQSTSKCSKFSVANLTSLKNSSTSALNSKKSNNNFRSTAVSCQCLLNNKDENNTRAAQTDTNEIEKNETTKLCDENICRTQMDEFKQKIVNLHEELSKTHDEYSIRITKLEGEVSNLRNENVRVRSERAASEHSLRQRQRAVEDMAERLRRAEAQYTELAMQLSIERRKVAELETTIKAAHATNSLVRTIEERFNANETRLALLKHTDTQETAKSPRPPLDWDDTSPRLVITSTPVTEDSPDTEKERDCTKVSKYSDDSGYTEGWNKSQVGDNAKTQKTNNELAERIVSLEAQLENIKKDIVEEELINLKEPSADQVRTPSVRYMHTDNTTKGVCETYGEVAGSSKSPQDAESVVETKAENIPNDVTAVTTSEAALNKYIGAGKPDTDYRMQIPGPLPVNSYDTPNSSNKKRLSNVDKFIKNYYHRKNAESKNLVDARVSKQENITHNETKTKSDKDQEGKVNNYTETRVLTDRDSISTFAPEIDRRYDEYFEKTSDSIDDDKSKRISNVERLSNPNESVDIKDSKNLSVRIKEFNIIDKENDFNSTSNTKDNLDANRQGSDLQSGSQLYLKINKNEGMVHDNLKDLSTNTENNCEINKTEKVTIENKKDDEFKEDNSKIKQCSNTDRTLVPPGYDKRGKKMVNCGIQYEPRDVNELGFQINNQVPIEGTQEKIDKASLASPRTYTLQGVAEVTDHDTDCEISSMTDLPSENEKSPRRTYSPGENKLTTTYTDSCTSPHIMSEYKSLSEGELPGITKASSNKLSYGEKPISGNRQDRDVSIKMEEALKTITEELARCKQLLLSQRPQEQPVRRLANVTTSTDAFPEPIALRHAHANQCISDTDVPKCLFTLHIGTVVLSDEAVLNSRNMSLVMAWQFYDHNLTMTKMRAGRVILFDFCTNYEAMIAEDFLHYMQHEEMSIKICEMDKQEQPYAVCALPLRNVLHSINKRVDMSLALVAGPRMHTFRKSIDSLDRGDEMGVLDLWCMLQAEPRATSAINRAIARPSSSELPPLRTYLQEPTDLATRGMQEELEDQSNLYTMSRDPEYSLRQRNKDCIREGFDLDIEKRQRYSLVESTLSGQRYNMDENNKPETDVRVPFAPKSNLPYNDGGETSECPSMSQRVSNAFRNRKTDKDNETKTLYKYQLQHTSSNIIPNVVPTNIKSTEEMKRALGRSIQDIPIVSTSGKNTKSAKSIHAQNLIQRMKKNFTKNKEGIRDIVVDEPTKDDYTKSFLTFVKHDSQTKRSKPSKQNSDVNTSTGSTKVSDTQKKFVTIKRDQKPVTRCKRESVESEKSDLTLTMNLDITVLWLALNEECKAIENPKVQRLYVAYSFLGRSGAELETPISLPKPTHYTDKCNFNFKKSFPLHDCDLPLLGHMARCRSDGKSKPKPKDCIIFTIVSEPPEDPLGLDSCVDIGHAHLYLGDIILYASGSDSYTEVIAIQSLDQNEICGVLAVKIDHLDVLRRCLTLTHNDRDSQTNVM